VQGRRGLGLWAADAFNTEAAEAVAEFAEKSLLMRFALAVADAMQERYPTANEIALMSFVNGMGAEGQFRHVSAGGCGQV
jgi:hypothetical protein